MLPLLKQFIRTKIYLRYILKNLGKKLLLVKAILLKNTPYFSDRYILFDLVKSRIKRS